MKSEFFYNYFNFILDFLKSKDFLFHCGGFYSKYDREFFRGSDLFEIKNNKVSLNIYSAIMLFDKFWHKISKEYQIDAMWSGFKEAIKDDKDVIREIDFLKSTLSYQNIVKISQPKIRIISSFNNEERLTEIREIKKPFSFDYDDAISLGKGWDNSNYLGNSELMYNIGKRLSNKYVSK